MHFPETELPSVITPINTQSHTFQNASKELEPQLKKIVTVM